MSRGFQFKVSPGKKSAGTPAQPKAGGGGCTPVIPAAESVSRRIAAHIGPGQKFDTLFQN
jgi:hypothetical protein